MRVRGQGEAGVVPELAGRVDWRAALTERTVEEDTQEMVDAGLPEPIDALNAQAVSLIAEDEAAWLSGDVAAILDHPARSFEQFAADNATAFSSAA